MKVIQKRSHPKFWTPEEDALLLANSHLTEEEAYQVFATKFPHRTKSSIMNRKSIIGAGRFSGQKRRKWTEQDYEFMRAHSTMSDADMARALAAGIGSLSSARKKADIRKVYLCKRCGDQLSQQGEYCKDHQYLARRRAAYTHKAKLRGFSFDLTDTQFHALLEGACTYCGSEGGGIDRMDSSKGYTADNTASCCWVCNAMKNNHATQDWFAHMEKVIAHIGASK